MQDMLDEMAGAVKTTNDRTCSYCKRDEADLPRAGRLFTCARCFNALYCNPSCQQTHWREITGAYLGTLQTISHPVNHKLNCAFAALRNGLYLKTMPLEAMVYDALIDAHRLRRDDECESYGIKCNLCLRRSPWPDFERFLDQAEVSRLLPEWWSNDKRAICRLFALRRGLWNKLDCKTKESDVVEYYRDDLMPTKLRVLAQRITGWPVNDEN